MMSLTDLLNASAAYHGHLCPRQVLGVRMGLLAGSALGLPVPQPGHSKRLFTIVETDGCFIDGIVAATNCWVGRRTMRVEDYGKIAATFVDCASGQAVRIAPHPTARARACEAAPEARNRWQAQLLGYQRLPAEQLFLVQPVELTTSVRALASRRNLKAMCAVCGEEIFNGREVRDDGDALCQACAGMSYYRSAENDMIIQTGQSEALG